MNFTKIFSLLAMTIPMSSAFAHDVCPQGGFEVSASCTQHGSTSTSLVKFKGQFAFKEESKASNPNLSVNRSQEFCVYAAQSWTSIYEGATGVQYSVDTVPELQQIISQVTANNAMFLAGQPQFQLAINLGLFNHSIAGLELDSMGLASGSIINDLNGADSSNFSGTRRSATLLTGHSESTVAVVSLGENCKISYQSIGQ